LIQINSQMQQSPKAQFQDRSRDRNAYRGTKLAIASDVKDHSGQDYRTGPAGEADSAVPLAMWTAVAPRATKLRLRRGQTIGLSLDNDTLFIVRSGALTLHVAMPDTARQIVAILLPGDLLRSSLVPPHANADLTAASQAEIWRLRWSELEDIATREPALARYTQSALAAQMTRQWVHLAAIARFSGEQRVATMLIELALRSAEPSPSGGFALDMPFSRKEVADYLGLNPDTLSRIMSRLRTTGVLGHSERNKIIVRDAAALTRLSPAASCLAEIYRERRVEEKFPRRF
jgi:CRP-like cAMP-binding protein